MQFKLDKIEWMNRMRLESLEFEFQTRRWPGSRNLELIVANGVKTMVLVEYNPPLWEREIVRLVLQVGRDYAIQPGRGKPGVWLDYYEQLIIDPLDAVYRQIKWGPEALKELREGGYWQLRMLVTDIREERLQDISGPDCWAEGVTRTAAYYCPWGHFGGRGEWSTAQRAYMGMWGGIYKGQAGKQWADNPAVFAISFQLRAM